MTYASLLSEEGIESQYLVVLEPRRLITSAWTNISGTKYSQTFSLGQIVSLAADGTSQTEASSSALSDGTWFYDTTTSTLYIDIGSDPGNSDIVVTYEIYLGTFDAHFYRDPLDNTTRVVYYEPLITQSPEISQSSTDDLFGFLPTISTSLSVSNTTQFLQEHVYASSFNNAEIKVYHYLQSLTVANTKLVTSGFCGNVSYDDNETRIEVFDNRALFDQEYRHAAGMNFYATATLSGLDPDFEAKPVRAVFGVVDKLLPVNIDFNADAASGTNNRDWVCLNPSDNLGSIEATVPASPTSTTTRTYVGSADGIRVGDTVWIDKSTDEYREVTVVNKTGDHYIEHDALVSGAATTGDLVKRSFVGSVTVVRQGYSPLKLFYKRDYVEYTDGTNKLAGFTLNDNFESAYNAANQPFNGTASSAFLQVTDLIYARVYGNTNQETLSASAFGSDSANTGNLAQAIVIAYSLLKNNVGLLEAEIDTTTFSSLQSSLTDEIGFSIPSKGNEDYPKYREILTDIFQSILVKFAINDSNEYSLVETMPLGSTTKTIEDDEILEGSFKYEFDYKDVISNVFVEYAPSEVSNKSQTGDLYFSKVSSTSNLATRLHDVVKQKTFRSLHFTESEAQTLSDRLSYALGERKGRITYKTKNRFFDTELNDVIDIQRTRMPGYAYLSSTKRSQTGAVVSAFKSLTDIEIEVDDQKGIEDNSGSW